MSYFNARNLSILALATFLTAGAARCAGTGQDSVPEPQGASQGAGSEGAGSQGSGASGASGASESAGASSGSGATSGFMGNVPDGVVRLLVIGDIGEGNEAQNAIADRMSEKCIAIGGCSAVVVTGDNFYDKGVESTEDSQWVDKFEKPYDRPGLNGLPFYVVLGNHDYDGNIEAQIAYTKLPVGTGAGTRMSDKWIMPEAYYDVVIGDVHLFAIDTNDYGSAAQENDMSSRVAMSAAPWKMVFGHHPRYTSGEHYWDTQLLGWDGLYDFQKAIYCGSDIYMTGHDHNMEFIDKGRDEECPDTYFVISGAASKTRDNFDFTPVDEKQLYYRDDIYSFAFMEFEGSQVYIEFIDDNGTAQWGKTLKK